MADPSKVSPLTDFTRPGDAAGRPADEQQLEVRQQEPEAEGMTALVEL
jgi:hypothetical protein